MKKGELKLKPLKVYLLRNKTCSTPWTMTLFRSEEEAWRYFEVTCDQHKWDFNRDSFICEEVIIKKS